MINMYIFENIQSSLYLHICIYIQLLLTFINLTKFCREKKIEKKNMFFMERIENLVFVIE